MAVSRGALRGAFCALLLLANAGVPAEAATFGVPTQIGTDGRVCTGAGAPAGIGCTAAAADPPGYLILTGVDDVDAAGDTVHQTRLFIEVTGTALDVRVFDAGRSGSRDEALSANTTFTYALYNPAGGLVKSIAIGADVAGITENRVARMSSAVLDTAFVALSAGAAFGVAPGLYELRVTASGAGGGAAQDDRNSFGVDIRNGTGAAAGHYNVYTYGLDDDAGQGTGAGATDTSLVIGALETGGNGGDISEDMIFYPYVTRGCSLATSNFDMDSQVGASTSITDTRGTNTALTVSGSTVHSENTVTIHAAAGVQNDVNNYGLFALQNDTGSQYNIIDWRIADFRGWADATTIPLDTTDALRTFLPNGYTGGVPPLTNATAPSEPVLAASYAYVSGRNPPAVGFLTRFVVQVQLDNPGPAAIALNAANDQIVSGLPAGATNLGNIRCFKGTFSNTVGTAVNGGTFARCNFSGAGVTLNTGESALLTYQFDFTPAAAGTFAITNVPAAPAAGTYNNAALGPNSTTWAQFSRFPTGTVKAETLGPVCDLRATTGTAVTRASLTGLRVDPAGMVEFATLGQRRTSAFNLYATQDRSGRGPRTLLNASPIVASVPDAIGPTLYRADTAPITAPYIQIEEIETTGRTRLMGPFAVGDARMAEGLVRAQSAPTAAGSPERVARAFGADRGAASHGERTTIDTRPGSFVKIEVAEVGEVRVPLADLQANGLPSRLALRNLHLTSQGAPVPFEIEAGASGAPEAIRFFNPGLSTAYTATNVFVVDWGTRPVRQRVDLTQFDAPVPAGSVRVERNRYYAPGAPLGTDPWLWDFVVSGEAWPRADDPTAGTFDLPELDVDPAATVAVRIRMGTVSPGSHVVDAEINGVSVGSVTFAGQRGATLYGSIPAADLHPTDNTLRLSYATDSDAGGLLYLGHVDIDAPRLGLASVAPLRLGPYEPLLAPPRVAQYLIVTHPDFRHEADVLARLKASEGYSTSVVEAQQAYDTYSGGVVEARAIARLIADVARTGKLKYVLLMGDDSFDPLNNFGTSSASYVPSLYAWDDEFGRIPSEVLFADVNGDRSPDVAIGRLPVQTAAQAEAVVAKIARQSATLRAQGGRQVFAVDNQGPDDPSFEGLAAAALARLPGKPVTWARIADGTDTARGALRQGLLAGAQATHFFGHGSFPMWADEGLLNADEVGDLQGPETVVFAWACESQWFLWPFGSSLGEALVLLPQGGAVASFGPTGITDPDAQAELLIELYPRAFSQNLTLGEAIRQAKTAALGRDPGRLGVVVHGFNLLGDPSLRLKQ